MNYILYFYDLKTKLNQNNEQKTNIFTILRQGPITQNFPDNDVVWINQNVRATNMYCNNRELQ
ncbi:hypothetical protein [Paenimyroides viscosum]|uniref:hypothetical protein n=1 Tax=Paenimyroides viscosum TaxID=2488729 RepID=UPI001315355D|nr:hypothetical protein [Paenimyroides viscosum]